MVALNWKLTTVLDNDGILGSITWKGFEALDAVEEFLALQQLTKHNMATIEPWGGGTSYEKLTTISSGSYIKMA